MYRCLHCGARFPIHAPICSRCWASHQIVLEGERPRAALDDVPELVSAKDLTRQRWSTVEVGAYPGLKLGRGALVVLVGRRGSGKSSFLARALDTIHGPAALVSTEEPAGPSISDRFGRLHVRRDDLWICSRATVDQVAEIVRLRKVVSLGIDSVQRASYEPRELRHLLLTLPSLAVLFAVSQVNRDGDVRGGEELGHECDVLVEVEALKWRVVKSRYQADGAGDVLRADPPEGVHVVAAG
jgi:predicted ATP-dependent serine protease